METCLAGADDWRGGSGPLVLERGPAENPLFGAFFEAAQQAGYPLTDDVNGYRQEGFARFDRNIHRGRRLSAARAYLHPVMDRKNLDVETLAFGTKLRFEGTRAVGVDYVRAGRMHRSVERRRGHPLRWRHQHTAAAAAVRRRQRRGPGRARHRRGGTTSPGWGRTCRTTSRSTSSTRASSRSRSPPVSSGGSAPASARSGCSCAPGSGPPTTSRAAVSSRSNDDVDYPNLMFHFLPIAIRYDGSSPTEGHGYQVHIGPMYSDARGTVKMRSTDPREHPALQFNYLSTETGSPGVGRGGPGRPQHPQPASLRARSTTASSRRADSVETR